MLRVVLTGLEGAGYCNDRSCFELCVCEVLQVVGEDERRCREEAAPTDLSGWCYVDPRQNLGEWSQVSDCLPHQQQALRVMDVPQDASQILMLTCEVDG